MTLHAPQNPLESDDSFYNIIEHSHSAQGAVPQFQQSSNSELDNLTNLWKKGKISYHDYSVQKYAITRANRSMGRTYKGTSQ